MTALGKIRVEIETGRGHGSGTDGNVYLGIAGREFRCDTSADDFERGSTKEYVFGPPNSNVTKRDHNNPYSPPLQVEEADIFPAYIRFAQGGNSKWQFAGAKVFLNSDADPHFIADLGTDPLWMGDDCGCIYYLRKPDPEGGRLKAG